MTASFKRVPAGLTVAGVTSYPLTVAGWKDKYLIRGASLAGIPAGQVGYFFEDFTDISRWQKISGTANLTAVATLPGGVGELACADSDDVLYQNGNATLGSPTIAQVTGKWYCAGRMRLPQAPAANGGVMIGLLNTGAGGVRALFGYMHVLSSTKFVSMVVGVGLWLTLSTISLDTTWHDFELWCDGSRFWLAVDDEEPLEIEVGETISDYLYPFFEVGGGNVIGTTGQFDKYLLVFPQAS